MTGYEKWSAASLRIFGTLLTSKQITQEMGVAPSYSHDIGDPVSKRNPQGPSRETAMWILESSSPSSDPVEAHIAEIMDIVDSKAILIEKLRDTCFVDLCIAFSSGTGQGSFTVETSLIQRIAARLLTVTVDLYPPERKYAEASTAL